MSAFDIVHAVGGLTSGQNQNKGLFFNELIGRLLEQCAGVGVAKRGKRRVSSWSRSTSTCASRRAVLLRSSPKIPLNVIDLKLADAAGGFRPDR